MLMTILRWWWTIFHIEKLTNIITTNITVTIECVKYKIIFSVILGRVRQWDDIYFSDDVQWIINSKKTNCSWKYWSIKGLASGTSKESVSNKSRKSNARSYIRLEKLTFGFYMICHSAHMISVELDLVIFRLKTLALIGSCSTLNLSKTYILRNDIDSSEHMVCKCSSPTEKRKWSERGYWRIHWW